MGVVLPTDGARDLPGSRQIGLPRCPGHKGLVLEVSNNLLNTTSILQINGKGKFATQVLRCKSFQKCTGGSHQHGRINSRSEIQLDLPYNGPPPWTFTEVH